MNSFKVNDQITINADAFDTTVKGKKAFMKHVIDAGLRRRHDEVWKRFKDFKRQNPAPKKSK